MVVIDYTIPVDADQDGYTNVDDCDDTKCKCNPGATESL